MFFKKTVATITSSLNDMVSELDEHAATKEAEQKRYIDRADELIGKAEDAADEIEAARAASAKIAALLS